MTDLVHTADVHLAPDQQVRFEALSTVVDLAEREGASAVTVGGDLFDRPRDVDTMRPALRNDLFAERDLEVLVIPGNHDVEAFRGDTFFGDACTVLLEEPFEHVELPDAGIRVTGLPYTPRVTEDLLVTLSDRRPYDGTEVLLIHCTLDLGFARNAVGAEDEVSYFPITPEELSALDFDFVLAGHHHDANRVQLDGGTFAYAGTPASTRRRETGPRRVATVDIAEDELRFASIDTFHYAEETFHLLPGREEDVLADIEEWVETAVTEDSEATVRVEGFHELDEETFYDRLVAASATASVDDNTVTARTLRAHPLYRSFEERLDGVDWDDRTIDAVRERTLRVLNDVRGEL